MEHTEHTAFLSMTSLDSVVIDCIASKTGLPLHKKQDQAKGLLPML